MKEGEISKLTQKVLILEGKLAQGIMQHAEENKNDDVPQLYSQAHPCFDFLNDFEEIKLPNMKAKKFYWEMVHPYSETPFMIKAQLDLCTIYNNVPYG